ncbi:acetyl-coenzyme A synthetase [Oxobacter pfennigii]|uniref:Acetyl-coenzyme A synthetase n=1 Tax=Oxobacter pfennigii TaxID=36849 RepID=A0A0P8W4A2_9CLOT|nr:acetate--CoA ligase [Oxobacter pfennigii]KPU42490.1 acetyl-coenzyme A synthetase [Oxobacter pfennigii]
MSGQTPKSSTIDTVLEEQRVFNPPERIKETAHIRSYEEYKELYDYSIKEPEAFWAKQAELVDWIKPFKKVYEGDLVEGEHKWYLGGKLNVSANCIDRHINTWRKNKAAIIWQGEKRDETRVLTYNELYNQVCRVANTLKKWGVNKGDRVALYMPMIPELAITMLACSRIGAIHNVVFGGFSADSLRDRINDSGARILITADAGFRRGAYIPLKDNADKALEGCPGVHTCIVVKHTGADINFWTQRDKWWHHEINSPDISSVCPPEAMDSEDPLFILYTSGSTGKPKGVMHTTGGYLVYTSLTMKYIFDLKEEDTFWCTADSGWITGHSYVIYGPLALGATTLMYEGLHNYPNPDRLWQVIEKYRVSIFYTAPTIIRGLMKEDEEWVKKHDLSSLRLLGTVGEPINPEAWVWYHKVVGNEKCAIVDTYWQTETGGVIITPLPGAIPTKPGSAAMPFFGIEPAIVDSNGEECDSKDGGSLIIKRPWPGLMRGVYNAPDRFRETYLTMYPGNYFTGDGARVDEDGYYWLLGRVDDVLNVSGHRLSTAEIESALVSHNKVAEAAVVGYPHDIKGEGIYAYVLLKNNAKASSELRAQLGQHVRKVIGPVASPDKIHIVEQLPKTRSGKIMRRILRKIASGEFEQLGDTSTLSNPESVDELIKTREE